MIYGYARVSTDGPNIGNNSAKIARATDRREAAQVHQLRAAGAATDRPQLRRLLAEINPGDLVMVTRLDRLARSTRDLLNTLAAISGKEAEFRSRGGTRRPRTGA
jgi:DNA invertase Pin-like site-specific DNA recombinase